MNQALSPASMTPFSLDVLVQFSLVAVGFHIHTTLPGKIPFATPIGWFGVKKPTLPARLPAFERPGNLTKVRKKKKRAPHKNKAALKYLEAERCLRNCLYVVTDAARLIRYNTKPDIKGAVALMQG